MTGLDDLATTARAVLLDFDGPICSIFAGVPAHDVARSMTVWLRGLGVPDPVGQLPTDDPLEVYRRAATERPDHATAYDQHLRETERRAVATAAPTPGGLDVIRACLDSGRIVAIVSNNSAEAVSDYLDAHAPGAVIHVVGRVLGRPDLMKPHPYAVHAGLSAAGQGAVEPSRALFVGDSITDVLAGRAAGVPTLGYANKPGKAARLTAAGADAITDDMRVLAEALTRVAVPLPN